MKNKRYLLKRILIVVSFIALCLGGAIYTNRFFTLEIIKQQEDKLSHEIDLMIAAIQREDSKLERIQLTSDFNYLLGEQERLTILNQQGTILYDSAKEEKAHGSRSQRPEIEAVLVEKKPQGFSLRDSTTLSEKLLYVAKPIYSQGKLVGVLRLSEKYAGVSKSIRQFQQLLIIAFILLLCAVLLLLLYFVRQQREPLRFILPALQVAVAHPEKQQQIDTSSPEWKQLYSSINQLMRESNQLYYQQLFTEEKLQFILESLTIGVFILNDQLELVSANSIMSELFATTNHSSQQAKPAWLENQKLAKMLAEVKTQKTQVQGEIKLESPQAKNLNVVLRLLKPDSQEIEEYVGIVYDITQIRQLEQIHQDFISNISHELKTPTTSIIGFTDTLLEGAIDDQTVARDFLKIIQVEGKRLDSLIKNILLLLRTETSLTVNDIMLVSPQSIVEEELERFKTKIVEKDLQITIDCPESLRIDVPSDYFQPIVKNVIENAVEYTEKSGEIKLTLKQNQQAFIFSVKDNGVGISEEEQQRVFERFYRVSKSRQRNTGGSGLGLSIVKHYAQLLNSDIMLESKLGVGTEITIKMPIS